MAKKRTAARARKSEVRAKKRVQAAASEVPPELIGLEDLPAYEALSPSAEQRAAYERAVEQRCADDNVASSDFSLGCVVRLDRGFPAVLTPDAVLRAEHAVTFAKQDMLKPAVGDWVCLRLPKSHEFGVIEQVLPRTSDIARWRGGSRGEKQTLAANVDLVIVAYALGAGRIDVNRLARSRVIALDCGADVAVVLTKADRSDDLARDCELVRAALGADVPLVACAAGAKDEMGELGEMGELTLPSELGVSLGVEAVRELVGEGRVAMLLGESGAGKSTLLNALLGRDLLQTGDVREKDDAGRHTTVCRRMVAIPNAGTIVDEPGLRTLPLVGHERGLALAFPEVADAACTCRFNDCTHEHEPGCGVVAALETGEIEQLRADIWRSLSAEMRRNARDLDPDIVL